MMLHSKSPLSNRKYAEDLDRPLLGIWLTTTNEQGFIHRMDLTSIFKYAESGNHRVIAFSEPDLSLQRGRILGWTLNKKGDYWQWRRKWFSLPKVIYNRITSRTEERRPMVQKKMAAVQEHPYKIPIFNPRFLNKDELLELLQPDLFNYLPETRFLHHVSDLEWIAGRHPVVYVKQSNGSLGDGIFRIIQSNQGWELLLQQNGIPHLKNFGSLEQIYRWIRLKYPNRKYLVQQGIDLKKSEGRPVDFRVHLHRNAQNLWEVVAIAAKVAGRGSVTTHVRNGGNVIDFAEILERWYDRNSAYYYMQVEQLSKRVANLISQKIVGYVGELGLDMGIDERDHLWIFEANSKPGRSIFKYPHLKQQSERSAMRVIEYASYLEKQNDSTSEELL